MILTFVDADVSPYSSFRIWLGARVVSLFDVFLPSRTPMTAMSASSQEGISVVCLTITSPSELGSSCSSKNEGSGLKKSSKSVTCNWLLTKIKFL